MDIRCRELIGSVVLNSSTVKITSCIIQSEHFACIIFDSNSYELTPQDWANITHIKRKLNESFSNRSRNSAEWFCGV